MKKNILWLAVALLTAFAGVSCSNEDILSEVPTPNPSKEVAENIVTFTATLDAKGGSGMRAVNASGTTTWVENEALLISYKNTSNSSVEAKATVTSVDESGKATITASLVNPKDGSQVYFYYPYDSWCMSSTVDFASGQDGSLSKLSQYFDYATGDSEDSYYLSVSGGVATLPSSINMVNQNIIWKLSFTDGTNDITSSITKLEIHASAGGTTDYTITPSPSRPITDYFYVAMGDLLNDDVVFTAHTSSGIYRRAKSNITLEIGKIYTTTGLALTKVEVGKVIGADGNIYANAGAATTAGISAVAKITYVGSDACEASDAPYNHGLALALGDVSGTTMTWCSQTDATCLGTGHQFGSEAGAKGDMAGIANTDALVNHTGHTHDAANAARGYNSGTHPAGTSAWFLPSAGQWYKMATAAGGYANLKTNAGLQGDPGYWSSTEYNASVAWEFNFSLGSWFSSSKSYTNLVRACLAF